MLRRKMEIQCSLRQKPKLRSETQIHPDGLHEAQDAEGELTVRGAALVGLMVTVAGCSQVQGAAREPGNPTPVAAPPTTVNEPPTTPTGRAQPGGKSEDDAAVPLRPAEAPLVTVAQVLGADSLVGRRVRVGGRCEAVGRGSRAGSWTLGSGADRVEVRGLVPRPCEAETDLVIFAQVEYRNTGGPDRILLRLPDQGAE